MPDSLETLLEQYRKYEGSTTVLFALSRLIIDNPTVGRLNGVTKDIQVQGGKITPDVSAHGQSDSDAIFLELKWSLTASTAGDELLKLKKYCDAKFSWTSGNPVTRKDVVLIVAQDDADIAVATIQELIKQGNSFLESVAIWKWFFAHPRKDQASGGGSDALWISKVFGRSGSNALDSLVSTASGYRVPKDVLELNKYLYRFTKDKPPVQYTIATLLLHVFSSLRSKSEKEIVSITMSLADIIYERSKSFFPGSESAESIQVRKQWIREALQALVNAGFKEVSIPFMMKGRLDENVCNMLLKKSKGGRKGAGMPKVKKPKTTNMNGQDILSP